jgi:hypothetical protein
MAELVYVLCCATSVGCALLLIRGYRRSRERLLLWSSLSFACLGLTNVLLFMDYVVIPGYDLSVTRSLVTLSGVLIMLYGLIWEAF